MLTHAQEAENGGNKKQALLTKAEQIQKPKDPRHTSKQDKIQSCYK